MSIELSELHEARFDVVIIGSGMAGSALAYSLRSSGAGVCIFERGKPFGAGAANWDPDQVISKRAYDPDDLWLDGAGRPFVPRTYYTTGGSSKFFGGSAFRFRRKDFAARSVPGGEIPAWPISYEELAPYYDEAERAMRVHGAAGTDPTETPRGAYPHPPLEHEPPIAWLAERFRRQGLRPFPLPAAVDQGEGGRCRKGSPCDGFPCRIRAKGDGENAFLRPALDEDPMLTLVTGARVDRIIHDATGARAVAVEVGGQGDSSVTVRAGTVVVAAGAVNSAALLLRSRSEQYPAGLLNASGVVGRHFMAHNNTVLMAFSPFRRNPTRFQKTLAIHDYYGELGSVQMRGKVLPQNLARSASPLRRLFRRWLAARTFDLWVMSEDVPDSDNRVTVDGEGRIRVQRTLNNMVPHKELVRRMRRHILRAGLPFVLEREPDPSAIQHQVGTVRFGDDPATSALDADCRAWDMDNLYVVDGSVFPSSAAVNPALTIAANALRVGAMIRRAVRRTGNG